MSFTNFSVEMDGDGIAVVTWDEPGRSMNVIDSTVMDELSTIVEQTTADAAVKGVVITSAKDAFCAGADLTMLESLGRTFAELVAAQGEEAATLRFFEESRRTSLLYRRIETCGKPWVAAINGTALGGGFELALACHRRIAADNPKTRLGQPEVKVGLLPGAGGTQRIARMLPPSDALRAAGAGQQADLDLRLSEPCFRIVGGDPAMTGERQFETAAQCRAVDGGNPGLTASLDATVEQRRSSALLKEP